MSSLHLGLTVSGPLILILVLLGDETVRLFVCLLHHRVAHLQVLLFKLMARQVCNYTCTNGVPEHIGGGAQSVPEGRQRRGEDRSQSVEGEENKIKDYTQLNGYTEYTAHLSHMDCV